jgi:hypothetical protein
LEQDQNMRPACRRREWKSAIETLRRSPGFFFDYIVQSARDRLFCY